MDCTITVTSAFCAEFDFGIIEPSTPPLCYLVEQRGGTWHIRQNGAAIFNVGGLRIDLPEAVRRAVKWLTFLRVPEAAVGVWWIDDLRAGSNPLVSPTTLKPTARGPRHEIVGSGRVVLLPNAVKHVIKEMLKP